MEQIEGFVLTPQAFLQLTPSFSDPPSPPTAVYEAFAELLKEHKQNGFARIRHDDIVDLVIAKIGITRRTATQHVAMVKQEYFNAGWHVFCDNRKDRMYYIFCAEPQLNEAALWHKYHPNEPMPEMTPQQRDTLVKMRPGWGGWDNEEKRGFPYGERERLKVYGGCVGRAKEEGQRDYGTYCVN